MGKWELISLRKTLYEIAGTIGTYAETIEDIELIEAYDGISKTIDCLENYAYDRDWIDISTNEIVEDANE